MCCPSSISLASARPNKRSQQRAQTCKAALSGWKLPTTARGVAQGPQAQARSYTLICEEPVSAYEPGISCGC
jgi:hypothetical protein